MPQTKATHVRIRVLTNQCTGAPAYQGDQDDDPGNSTDCDETTLPGFGVNAERVRIERWGPRTLDVDVLLVGDLTVDEPDLEVPHPRMWQGRFVLAPLADLAPDLVPVDALAAAEGDVRPTGIDLQA